MSMTETSTELPPNSAMPEVSAFDSKAVRSPAASSPATATPTTASPAATLDECERNPVFSSLVTEDSDVIGLVAYSIYKQNKHDWLLAFLKAKGRDPDESEVASYILGESTPRRLATYRHLAQATLEGKGPDVQIASGRASSRGGRLSARQTGETILGQAAGYVITAIAVLVLVLLAIRFGIIPSPR